MAHSSVPHHWDHFRFAARTLPSSAAMRSENRLPASRWTLPEQPHGGIPGALWPIQHPAKIGIGGQGDPNRRRPVLRPGGTRPNRYNDQVQFCITAAVSTKLMELHEIRDRKCHMLELFGSRPLLEADNCTPGTLAKGRTACRRTRPFRSLLWLGLPCHAMPILNPEIPASWRLASSVPAVSQSTRRYGNLGGNRRESRRNIAGKLMSGAWTSNGGIGQPSGMARVTPSQPAASSTSVAAVDNQDRPPAVPPGARSGTKLHHVTESRSANNKIVRPSRAEPSQRGA